MPTLSEIAAGLGLPCFPCDAEKRPLVAGGFKSAAFDRSSIAAAFRKPNAVMIGVPTGKVSGWVAIDVDIKGSNSGMAWLETNAAALPPTRTHRTRSGGLHLIFRYPTDTEIRNSAGRLAPGIDVRGEGGYIIVPPSPGYAVADPIEPAEMPGWLIHACMKPDPPPRQTTEPRSPRSDGGTHYGLAALADECNAIRAAPFGEQETTINAAALKIGSLVSGGELEEGIALAELLLAAKAMPSQAGREPWNQSRLEEKVRRAFSDGKSKPRQAPPRSEHRHEYGENYSSENSTPEQEEIDSDDPPLTLEMFDDITASLDANDFVEGLFIERSGIVVYGESNCGKTFWLCDLALHVAAGLSWNNREVLQGGVVYVVLEGNLGFRNRIEAWRLERADDRRVCFAAVPQSINLLAPDADTEKLIATIKVAAKRFGIPVKLVIIDTLSRALAGGNENSPEDMGALVTNMDRIRGATQAAVAFVHHCGKDSARGARGHSLLRAAVDTEIEVVAIPGSPPSHTATVVKQRDMETAGEFEFHLKIVELGTNRRGKAVTSCVVETGGAEPSPMGAKRRIPDGRPMLAYRILCDAIAEAGQAGFNSVPDGLLSIPDDWWRERFYERALPGAERKTREKAFRRAADTLIECRAVAMNRGRVWLA
jgi:hypothetical protein